MYRTIVAEYIGVIAKGMRIENSVSFREAYKKIYGIDNNINDNRSAKEIIEDTIKSMNLTLVE